MEFTRQLGVMAILVTGTLWLQSAGMAFLIHWARSFIARGIRGLDPMDVGCPHDPFRDCDGCLARSANSPVGRLLSMAMSSIMGVLLLFFGHQLFDCWLW